MELGQVITANHYALLRQRLTQDGRGAWLSMVVRGPSEQRFALEEMLGTHRRVLSFEAALCEEATAISVASSNLPLRVASNLQRRHRRLLQISCRSSACFQN